MKPAHEIGGPTELNRLFEEAIRCLEGADLPGANAALKKAHAEVVSTGDATTGAPRTGNGSEDRG